MRELTLEELDQASGGGCLQEAAQVGFITGVAGFFGGAAVGAITGAGALFTGAVGGLGGAIAGTIGGYADCRLG